MQRVTVPGGYVDFREPEETPERLRRKVMMLSASSQTVAARVTQNTDSVETNDIEFLTSFNDSVAMCLVMGWSFDQPLTTDGLQDLPGNVYDAIIKHVQPLTGRLLPNFSVDPDPKVPIDNS